MPIHKVTGGFQWGGRGKLYTTREGAARQARAAYANGYVGKSLSQIGKGEKKDDNKGALAAAGLGTAAGGGIAAGTAVPVRATPMNAEQRKIHSRLKNKKKSSLTPKEFSTVAGGRGGRLQNNEYTARMAQAKREGKLPNGKTTLNVFNNTITGYDGAHRGHASAMLGENIDVKVRRINEDKVYPGRLQRHLSERNMRKQRKRIAAHTALPESKLSRMASKYNPALNKLNKLKSATERGPALPIALGTVGAGAIGAKVLHDRKQVNKAYQPTYFGGSVPTERLHAQRQRTRTEASAAALQAGAVGAGGASAAALGARMLGHDAAPAAVRAAGLTARKQGVPKETVKDLTRRADKIHTWARGRRGRLLAGATAAAGLGTAAKIGSRWKRDEVTGISQDLGRASAGDRLQSGSRHVNKSIATAVASSYGVRGAKKWASLDSKTRDRIVQGTVAGSLGLGTTAGTAAGIARRERWHDEKKRLKAAGGVSGPVMKSEFAAVGKALGGSNVREYGYLPENIRQDVGAGSIGIRRNPMSALDLFASSRVMTQAAARANRERISRRQLSQRAHNEMNFAGSRAMLYSPTGRGSVF